MQKTLVLVAALALAACSNRTETESGGALDTTADTTATIRIPDIDVGTTTDTVNVPTLGTRKDTIIVDRPVVTGRRPVEVKRPTVETKNP